MNHRLLSAVLSLALLIFLVGCGETASPPSASPSASSPATSPDASATPPQASDAAPQPTPDPIRERIDGMTLEQKIGQMLFVGVPGAEMGEEARRIVQDRQVGGVILFKDNLKTVESSVALVNELKAANKGAAAPLWIGVDQEGGRVNRMPGSLVKLPSNWTVGKTGDADRAGEMGALLARQVKLLGMNVDFAPVLDVRSNPGNTVIGDRSFGAAAETVAAFGAASMAAIAEGGVLPVVKHFPGHGDTKVDSHLDLPVIDKTQTELEELELVPFREAVEQGAEAVMVGHLLIPALDPDFPASLSAPIIRGMLREKLGFDGLVITDDLTMDAISEHYTLEQAAPQFVQAGGDMLMIVHDSGRIDRIVDSLRSAVREGTLTEERIDESVERILRLKEKYGLTDEPVPVPDLTALNEDVRSFNRSVGTK